MALVWCRVLWMKGVADFVLALAPPPTSSSMQHESIPVVEQNESDADTLFRRVENMHIEADSVRLKIAAESGFDSVFSSTRTKNDASFGPVVELKTNTPINHADYRLIARLFWTRARKTNGTLGAETVVRGHTRVVSDLCALMLANLYLDFRTRMSAGALCERDVRASSLDEDGESVRRAGAERCDGHVQGGGS